MGQPHRPASFFQRPDRIQVIKSTLAHPEAFVRVEPIADQNQRDPRMSRKTFTLFVAVTVAIGGLLFGYDTAVIAGAILFVREHFQLSPGQTELAVSVALAGALAGAAVAGYLGDRLGRRTVLAFTAVFYGVFAVGTGMANGLTLF